MKILIIRLSSIGDCVLASPVVQALRERYPDAHLTWAVQAKSQAVVRGLPGLDSTLLWDDRRHRLRSLLRALLKTWRGGYDIALDLQGLDKAGLFSWASHAQRRVTGAGAHRIAAWSSTEQVSESEPLHAREFYLRRAMPLGIAPDAAQRYFPAVPITSLHRRSASDFLAASNVSDDHQLVGLNLGAAHAVKRWAPERFAQLADELLARREQTRVVVFGAPADAALLEQFEAELSRLHRAAKPGTAWDGRLLVAVARLDLLQMAAVAERCAAFVTADTGPMHIAAAVGAPIVALFGPTNPALTGPVQKPGAAPVRVLQAPQAGNTKPTMNDLPVDDVLREVNMLLDDSAVGPPALRLLRRA